MILSERVALAVASAVLLVAVVTSAVGVPGGEDEAPTAAGTASPGAPPTSSPAVSPQTTEAATAPPPAGGVSPVPAAPSAPVEPGPATPPRPGTYRYREVTDGETTEESVRYADRGGGRQTEFEEGVSSEVAWRGDGKFVLETTFGEPPEGFRCDWEPDVLEYRLPMSPGISWETTGTCTPAPGFTLSFAATSQVTGAERVRVVEQDVDTWAIRTEATLSFETPEGTSTQRLTADDRFSPAHGLSVRSSETLRGADPATGEDVDETSTSEILNLAPA